MWLFLFVRKEMNNNSKQTLDLFQKIKIKKVSEKISRMTYSYINPDTNQPIEVLLILPTT